LPRLLGIDRHWGVAGLTLSAGIAGWVEFVLLRRALQARIGVVLMPALRIPKLWTGAILAAVLAYGLKLVIPFHLHGIPDSIVRILAGLVVLSVFSLGYLLFTVLLGVELPARVSRLWRRA
jgi:putative peptidoglycan lipid II flippase